MRLPTLKKLQGLVLVLLGVMWFFLVAYNTYLNVNEIDAPLNEGESLFIIAFACLLVYVGQRWLRKKPESK